MANMILFFHNWHVIGYLKPPPILIFVFVFIITMSVSASQPSLTNCSLDFQYSYFQKFFPCGGDWDGFLRTKCCGTAFSVYLNALAKRTNQTGKMYLNATEQRNCLTSLKSLEGNVFSCGIEKLVSGAGGCSDFSVADVVSKLGDELRNLQEDCKLLGSDQESNKVRSSCLNRWEEMKGFLTNSKEFAESEPNVCRFAVLVSLISNRIEDEKWVQAVYVCLGDQSLNQGGEESNNKKKKLGIGLWIIIGGLIGTAVVVMNVTWMFLKRRIRSTFAPRKDASKEFLPEDPTCQKIPIKEIYSATNNLNMTNFIGQGIAGKVYKGVLSSGRHVAVKHIISDCHMETFVREVTSLSHVRHPNLVALLGYYEEEDECFLVYDLCPNGNLSEWLYCIPLNIHRGKDKILSWIQRIEIAIDSARGLWFLHTYPEGCIVHRDIKPTNILIGKNFEAKLSDFGLSKVIDLGKSYMSSEVRGTFGYVDPEYQRNHHVNSSGDVYSFGIVLLQILSGKRVINLSVRNPMPLGKMAKILTKGGNITEFADPKLNGQYSLEAFDLILKLALSCTTHKQQRPSMEQIVRKLENALDISTRENKLTS